MSLVQLRRYYDLQKSDFNGTPIVQELVRPVHARPGDEHNTTFLLVSKNLGKLSTPYLAHRAGTAEIRHQLGIAALPYFWTLNDGKRQQTEMPDATWQSMEGPVAVEYDSGAYSPTKIAFKLDNFRQMEMVGVRWGTTSSLRQRNLTDRYDLSVLLAEWWK